MSRRIELMGIPIDCLDFEETLARVEEMIAEGGPHQHMAVNAGKFVSMTKDAELARIVAGCDLINADGAAIVYASQLLGQPLPERVAGVDLFVSLVALAAEKGYRPYFIGARQDVVDAVVETFRERHPALDVAGWRDGYFGAEDEPGIVAAIRESRADMVFVAISSPKKEKFLGRWLEEMGVPFCMGVGGSFDVVAGKTARAPQFLQNVGMEWAWRLAQEPRRMWRRYLVGNTLFVARVVQARIAGFRIEY